MVLWLEGSPNKSEKWVSHTTSVWQMMVNPSGQYWVYFYLKYLLIILMLEQNAPSARFGMMMGRPARGPWCYPEGPGLSGEMGWQDPHEVHRKKCKVLHLVYNPRHLDMSKALSCEVVLQKRTWVFWWTPSWLWVSSVAWLQRKLTLSSAAFGGALTSRKGNPSA